jgi:hypothetical protein
MVFDQFVDGVFKGAGFELVLKRNGNHDHLVVLVRFESGHHLLQMSIGYFIIPLFRQFQRFALLAGGRDWIKLRGQDSAWA